MSQEQIFKIISGGQTGADRAGLDWAIANGIPHGGWCPAGRKAEDGTIPHRYNLNETESPDYPTRTEKNILDSDATVIFSMNENFDRGTKLTIKLLKKYKKPYIVIINQKDIENSARILDEFLYKIKPDVLNIAGPRQSAQPEVYDFALNVLNKSKWLNKFKTKH
ncbi:MAG: putative molybdenum carrier protein [Limisphaerales bacterium]|jgi:predicted Rossmann-fold nucleotide-binding protein